MGWRQIPTVVGRITEAIVPEGWKRIVAAIRGISTAVFTQIREAPEHYNVFHTGAPHRFQAGGRRLIATHTLDGYAADFKKWTNIRDPARAALHQALDSYFEKLEEEEELENAARLQALPSWRCGNWEDVRERIDEVLLQALDHDGNATLCLENQRLEDDTIELLAEMLQHNHRWQRLDLSNNRIRIIGVNALTRMASLNPFLQELNLQGNNIGEAGATAFAQMLECNTTLQRLNLRNTHIGDAGAGALALMLGRNTSLQELSLEDNDLGHSTKQLLSTDLRVQL